MPAYPPHKTSAWPLALSYAALIVYASLYPFADWRDQGIAPWAYLWAPLPKYWTGFDLAVNVLGYMPLGLLLALSGLRTGRVKHPIWVATLVGGLLSMLMEGLQSYLPMRVPSNVDLGLNLWGSLAGAALANLLEQSGVVDRWSRLRQRWFVSDARGALVLLALWPFALLFPPAVPLGLGQVLERVESGLADLLQDSPLLDMLPLRAVELQPLVPLAELVCVMLGALIPCLLAYGITRSWVRRLLFMLAILLTGILASGLSAALSYGPNHAWAWFEMPVQVGLGAALVLGCVLLGAPRRACAALLLLALGVYLSLLNQAPASAYFAQTLQTWEQGRFIRFHGVGQWLGWLWPYAALGYVLAQVWARDAKN